LLGDDVLAEIGGMVGEVEGAAGGFLSVKEVTRKHVKEAFRQRGSMTQKELAEKLGISANTLKGYLRS
jgi:DNA-binding MarR family transcriptional regulator